MVLPLWCIILNVIFRYFLTAFQSKLDAKSNYEAFYPNSTWTGDNGFNVSNASVKEYGIIANNGYIHAIDRVLEPLETIYTEMKNGTNILHFQSIRVFWRICCR